MMDFDIKQGSALDVLKQLPDQCVQMCVTSPPYYLLRQYGTNPQVWDGNESCTHQWGDTIKYEKLDTRTPEQKAQQNCTVGSNKVSENFAQGDSGSFCTQCSAWKGELGLEPNVGMYINHLIQIFAEVKRVVRDDGTIWVNLGDTFQGSGKGFGSSDPMNTGGRNGQLNPKTAVNTMQRKSLMSVPSRFEIAMVDELDLCLRNEIIWHKNNAMPQPAKDKFTIDHEKVYMFSKQPKYKFNQQLEPYTSPMNRWGGDKLKADGESTWDEGTGQNTYRDREMRPNPKGRNKRTVWTLNFEPSKNKHYASYPTKLVETPILAGSNEGDWVLDPFNGTATTGIVALRNNRNYLGIELLPEYIDISYNRIYEYFDSEGIVRPDAVSASA